MGQYQSKECNACKLPKGTRVHSPDTGKSGTVTRSRSGQHVWVIWDGNKTATRHDSITDPSCSSLEVLKEETMSQLPNAIEFQVGARVYNKITSRKGVVISIGHEGLNIRVRYDEDDSDTTIGLGLLANLEVIGHEHPIVTEKDPQSEKVWSWPNPDIQIDEERKPDTTAIETYLSSNVTSRRGQRLAEHAEVIKKRQALMNSEMLLLGQALFAMALYTSKPTTKVENCEFGVSLHDDSGKGALHIVFYPKEPEAEESQPSGITWKEIASPEAVESLAKDQKPLLIGLPEAPIAKLLSLIFKRRFGIKKEEAKPINPSPNAEKSDIMGTYSINTRTPEWTIIYEAFPTTLIKLLPTATALVQAELDLMQQATIDDITYIEAFELEVSEE